MPETFSDEECYLLFVALDDQARAYRGTQADINALRERLLPFYAAWHEAHPAKVHPSASRRVSWGLDR